MSDRRRRCAGARSVTYLWHCSRRGASMAIIDRGKVRSSLSSRRLSVSARGRRCMGSRWCGPAVPRHHEHRRRRSRQGCTSPRPPPRRGRPTGWSGPSGSRTARSSPAARSPRCGRRTAGPRTPISHQRAGDLDAESGCPGLLPDGAGTATDTVRAVTTSADGNTVYVAGEFGSVGGVGRNRVAALDVRRCTVPSLQGLCRAVLDGARRSPSPATPSTRAATSSPSPASRASASPP